MSDLDFSLPRYRLGQVVYAGTVESRSETVTCPDCLGTNRWKAITPGGQEIDLRCPACESYSGRRSTTRTVWFGRAKGLTIGAVRIDTTELEAGAQTSYMCEETGIGSGALWRERDLFLTPAEAQVAADAKAADMQAKHDAQPHVEQQRRIYLHHIVDALRSEKEAEASAARWRVRDLADAVQAVLDDHQLPQDAAEELRDALASAERGA